MIKIRIRNLFGIFNYDIELCKTGISILTGPNGFGKSTIIKCIKALGESDIVFFKELKFESFELKNQLDDITIKIENKQDGLWINEIHIDEEIIDYASRKSYRRIIKEEKSDDNEKYYSIMLAMKKSVGNVEYIEEQRLVVEKDNDRYYRYGELNRSVERTRRIIQAVDEIPKKMEDILRQVSLLYSKKANALDSTFPIRLFNQKEGINKEEFEKNMQEMQEKLHKMYAYGITNISKSEEIQFKLEDARALKVYFDDFKEKYEIYDGLIHKLDLYTEMVNSRFQFKKINISMESGFSIVDKFEHVIALKDLSSGEKETLVLFFRLLFEVKDNSLLLIDEPEISLHIAWQRMFAKDIKKIMDLKKLRVIIATHSAQIINGNYDIQIDLGEYYGKWIQLEKAKN